MATKNYRIEKDSLGEVRVPRSPLERKHKEQLTTSLLAE